MPAARAVAGIVLGAYLLVQLACGSVARVHSGFPCRLPIIASDKKSFVDMPSGAVETPQGYTASLGGHNILDYYDWASSSWLPVDTYSPRQLSPDQRSAIRLDIGPTSAAGATRGYTTVEVHDLLSGAVRQLPRIPGNATILGWQSDGVYFTVGRASIPSSGSNITAASGSQLGPGVYRYDPANGHIHFIGVRGTGVGDDDMWSYVNETGIWGFFWVGQDYPQHLLHMDPQTGSVTEWYAPPSGSLPHVLVGFDDGYPVAWPAYLDPAVPTSDGLRAKVVTARNHPSIVAGDLPVGLLSGAARTDSNGLWVATRQDASRQDIWLIANASAKHMATLTGWEGISIAGTCQ